MIVAVLIDTFSYNNHILASASGETDSEAISSLQEKVDGKDYNSADAGWVTIYFSSEGELVVSTKDTDPDDSETEDEEEIVSDHHLVVETFVLGFTDLRSPD